MKFEQTNDLIDHAKSFHQLIGEYYQSLEQKTENPRLKMLLDYLIEHERNLQDRLAEYSVNAPNKVMKTWFQFATCDERFHQLKSTLGAEEVSAEDVIVKTICLYDCIIQNFEELAKNAEIDEIRDVFQSIAAMERKEQRKIVRNSRMLDDL
jgi:rubrerythrin